MDCCELHEDSREVNPGVCCSIELAAFGSDLSDAKRSISEVKSVWLREVGYRSAAFHYVFGNETMVDEDDGSR
jgi:hypothetical protein